MDQHFDFYQQLYDKRFQAKYGSRRPFVKRSVTALLKCGDLKEGFARVRPSETLPLKTRSSSTARC